MLNRVFLFVFLFIFIHLGNLACPPKTINFKPFPAVPGGKTVWDVVTPKYIYRQGQPAVPLLDFATVPVPQPTRLLQTSNTANKDAVRQYIWPWMVSPIGNNLPNINSQSGQGTMSQTKQLVCYLKVFDYSNPSEDLLNSDQPLDVLYPGSFVQGKKIGSGADILQKLPISQAYRFPIRVAGNGNFVPVWANSSEAGDVHRAIKEAIWNSQGFYSPDVYIKLVKSSEITDLFAQLNVNIKFGKILGISDAFSGNWKTKKNKYFITMLQGIADFFPDKYVSDGSLINDAVGVFLRNNFTVNDAKVLQNLGYWGDGNIPCYVNQVTYGRLMVISVEQNERTTSLYSQMNSNISIYGIGASSNLTTLMNQMFQESSIKVFSSGPFSPVQVNDLRTGVWQNFFVAIPSNAATIQALKPIGFRVQDFRGQNVKVSNRLQYEQVECQTIPSKNIKIQIFDVYKSGSVQIKKSGQPYFTWFQGFGQGTTPIWDITSWLTTGDNDELRITNTGGRPNWISRWQRKARLIIAVDNAVVYNDINQCKGCHSTDDAFRCRIDKYSGAVSCWKG